MHKIIRTLSFTILFLGTFLSFGASELVIRGREFHFLLLDSQSGNFFFALQDRNAAKEVEVYVGRPGAMVSLGRAEIFSRRLRMGLVTYKFSDGVNITFSDINARGKQSIHLLSRNFGNGELTDLGWPVKIIDQILSAVVEKEPAFVRLGKINMSGRLAFLLLGVTSTGDFLLGLKSIKDPLGPMEGYIGKAASMKPIGRAVETRSGLSGGWVKYTFEDSSVLAFPGSSDQNTPATYMSATTGQSVVQTLPLAAAILDELTGMDGEACETPVLSSARR